MRIAIDVRSLIEGRHTGVEEYTEHIIRSMVRVAPSYSYHLFYNAARNVHLPDFGNRVSVYGFHIPNKMLFMSQWVFARPRWDRLLPVMPDVIFVPNLSLIPISSEVPIVAVAHDVSFMRFPEFLTLRRRIWHRMIRPYELMQNSNHIIAVSDHTKYELMQLYRIPRRKITRIYSGVSANAAMPRAADIQRVRSNLQLPHQYVLFCGCLEPRKNIQSIITAFSAIASSVPHHLVIAGERGWKQDNLVQAARRSPARDRIHVVGFVKEQDKMPLYAGADLFVFPSFYEGFGFPPLEALIAGTPVIASFNSSLPEVVGKWATLVDPYNTSLLAAVMREHLYKPTRIPFLIQQQIRTMYSWEKAAKKTIKVIEEVVYK